MYYVMYFIRTLRILFMPNNKINHTLQKMVRKKCGCNDDGLPQHNLNSSSSQMGYRFNILQSPVKSASDKKDYR